MSNESSSEKKRRKDLLIFAYFCLLLFWSICQAENIAELYARNALSIEYADGKEFLTDFVHFYIAGTIAGSSDSKEIYNPKIQEQVYNRVVGPSTDQSSFFTQHVPMLFMMMIPFAQLPINTAHLVWDILSFIIGATGLIFLETVMLGKSLKTKVAFFVAILASFPSWQTFINGQLSWLLLGLVCGLIMALVNRNELCAGLFLALLSIKPQYVPFLFLPALFLGRFKLLAWAVIFLGLIVFIVSDVVGFSNFLAYPSMIREAEANALHVAPELMPCARGLLNAFLGQQGAFEVMLPVTGSGLLLLFVLFFNRRRTLSSQIGLCWAMRVAILFALFFSPHTHAYDCLLIGAAAVLMDTTQSVRFAQRPLSAKIWWILLMSYPVTSWICFFIGRSTPITGMQVLAIINLILLLCAVRQFLLVDPQRVSAPVS